MGAFVRYVLEMTHYIDLRSRILESDLYARDRALEVNQAIYRWKHLAGLPAFCDGLPKPEVDTSFDAARAAYDITTSIGSAAIKTVGWTLYNARKNKLTHYDRFSLARTRPKVASRWLDDEEFARQRLNGVNPLLIERCEEIPEKFAVTNDRVHAVIGPETLETLAGTGRLYLCDWQELEGVPVNLGRFLTAPMALFWLDRRKVLMPLAIQLGQSAAEAPFVFTPADDRWLWLTARTHVQTADAAYHEVLTHLFRTHLSMETVKVALCRALPPQHPVHELLDPFFAGTISINHKARNDLIAPGGPIDLAISVGSDGAYWLMNQANETFKFTDLHPIKNLRERRIPDLERPYLRDPHDRPPCQCDHTRACKRIEDPKECDCSHTARCLASDDKLPGYHYRDDVLLLWDAVGRFAHKVLRLYYKDDAAVAADEELADWCRELTSREGGRMKGLPLNNGKFTIFADLRYVVQQVIFTASCEHSAVNNGQYDYFGYIPNAPGSVYLPPPKTLDPKNEAEFCYMLPPMKSVDVQMTLVHLLSAPPMSRLGDFPDQFFLSIDPVHKEIDRFRDDLDQIALHIQERNKHLPVPYTYLDPVQIAGSVNV